MIELKKEFVFFIEEEVINEETFIKKIINKPIVIRNFSGLLTYIIKKEGLIDYVESREDWNNTYHYITNYYENEGISLSDVIIERNNEIYNEIIELIKGE